MQNKEVSAALYAVALYKGERNYKQKCKSRQSAEDLLQVF